MSQKLEVGQPAPDLELPSHKGGTIRLSSLRGKKVVLFFYPKDGSPGCKKEVCTFRDSYEVFRDEGAEVFGISGDSLDSHREFAESNRLQYHLLSDEGDEVREAFGASSLGLPGRVTYVIDKEGIVRHIFSSQLQPRKHIEEALKVLREMEG